MADDIDLADLIADLRLRLEWGLKLMPDQVEYLLEHLPACEEPSPGPKSPGPKPDPDLSTLHEAISTLFALYRANGMRPKDAIDKIKAHCKVERSTVYAVRKEYPIKLNELNIAPSFLPGLIGIFENVTDAAAPNMVLASIWLMAVKEIVETRALNWDGLIAALKRKNAEEPPL